MKIKIFILFMLFPLFCFSPVKANNCSITCPSESLNIMEKETVFKQITGVNFVSKKIAETVIQKEINDELNSKINAKLEIFTVKRLKNGEFKSLILESKNIRYRAFSMSDFYARTICPFNRVVYKKSRIYYPADLPFKYRGSITNADIQNIINSKEFQNEIKRTPVKINGVKIFKVNVPSVLIKDGKLYFEMPVDTLLGSITLKFNTDIEVKNNKIVLKNINFNSRSGIINNDIFAPLIDKINPVSYEINEINGKYHKIFITKAKISDNIINTEGVFIINKNYNGEK